MFQENKTAGTPSIFQPPKLFGARDRFENSIILDNSILPKKCIKLHFGSNLLICCKIFFRSFWPCHCLAGGLTEPRVTDLLPRMKCCGDKCHSMRTIFNNCQQNFTKMLKFCCGAPPTKTRTHLYPGHLLHIGSDGVWIPRLFIRELFKPEPTPPPGGGQASLPAPPSWAMDPPVEW